MAFVYGSNRKSFYLNITNRCSNSCIFCVRDHHDYSFGPYNLLLTQEPTLEELKAAIDKFSSKSTRFFSEAVFCGYGEPTYRMDIIVGLGPFLHKRGFRVRINTNGQGNLINKTNIVNDLCMAVDSISISLNVESEEKYSRYCQPIFGSKAYPAILKFAEDAAKQDVEVILSAVGPEALGRMGIESDIDYEKCEEIAHRLGCRLRVR